MKSGKRDRTRSILSYRCEKNEFRAPKIALETEHTQRHTACVRKIEFRTLGMPCETNTSSLKLQM